MLQVSLGFLLEVIQCYAEIHSHYLVGKAELSMGMCQVKEWCCRHRLAPCC